MKIDDIKQLLLSQPAILIYEVLAIAVFIFLIVRLTKIRKQRKNSRLSAQERQAKQSLDDSLSNQRRR